MRSNQSHSKLMQSGERQSRAQNQKELRQAQRQTHSNNYFAQTDNDASYSMMQQQAHQGTRTVKNNSMAGTRHHQSSFSSSSIQTGADLTQTAGAGIHHNAFSPMGATQMVTKNNLQAARAKISTGASSNLFGGLSRHVLNANNRGTTTPGPQSTNQLQQRGSGSTGYIQAKIQHEQQLMTPRQTSQHNANYIHPLRQSPSGPQQQQFYAQQQQQQQQPCARTLAALESMNQSQMKMRKSESVQQTPTNQQLQQQQYLMRGQQVDNYLSNSIQQHQLIVQPQTSQMSDPSSTPKMTMMQAQQQNQQQKHASYQQSATKTKHHRIQKMNRSKNASQTEMELQQQIQMQQVHAQTVRGTPSQKQQQQVIHVQQTDESLERMRSYSDLQQFAKPQPQPMPHRQFLSPDFAGQVQVVVDEEEAEEEQADRYDNQAILLSQTQQQQQRKRYNPQQKSMQSSKRSSLIQQSAQKDQKLINSRARAKNMLSPNASSSQRKGKLINHKKSTSQPKVLQQISGSRNQQQYQQQADDDSPAAASATEQNSSQEQIISIHTHMKEQQQQQQEEAEQQKTFKSGSQPRDLANSNNLDGGYDSRLSNNAAYHHQQQQVQRSQQLQQQYASAPSQQQSSHHLNQFSSSSKQSNNNNKHHHAMAKPEVCRQQQDQQQQQQQLLAKSKNPLTISNNNALLANTDQKTLATNMMESLSQDNMMMVFPERDTTPERITPITKKEIEQVQQSSSQKNNITIASSSQNAHNVNAANSAAMSSILQHHRQQTNDVSVAAHLCCHEQTKQQAVLLQKVSFMAEQIKEEKQQAQMKEVQYNKIIDALKKTSDENNKRQNIHQQNAANGSDAKNAPGLKDWNDTLDELNRKKEEVNSLEEKVLNQELLAEKLALDHKNRLQQKDDEISEEHLKFKHKESDYRLAMNQIERLNEDIQSRIQEALDRQSDRLASEKQADLDAMNRRNEQLIKQLVESHSKETRQLRDLLLQQERKCRESEASAGNLEIELRTIKLENNNRFDSSEMEEIQLQNQQATEMRLQGMKAQFTDENQQLRDVIEQLESHINQLQESRSETDRMLIIAEGKVSELMKEITRNKILIASQKEKEEKAQQTFKAQITKERKTADVAVSKLKGVQRLEQELNKKQILINQLKAKIQDMEREELHKSKILLMKRRQIEDEKTVLIKKQALRQRSMTKSNLSTTRLQHQLDNKQAVILTERESKKALQDEKQKLEKEIQSIKREKGLDSSRHNESMSMYFARSQSKQKHNDSHMMFSPRTKVQNNTTKSFIANAKRSMTKSSQVMMSQQQFDRNQLYLSKQFSNERTSSLGRQSLQGCESMVNIVEFEEDASNRSRAHVNVENNSMLSTAFNLDEPGDNKSMHYRTHNKFIHSQSVLASHSKPNLQGNKPGELMSHPTTKNQPPHQQHHEQNNNKFSASSKITGNNPAVTGAGVAQFQTYPMHLHGGSLQQLEQNKFKTDAGKKIEGKKVNNNKHRATEAEFIQVLSGCDSSNEDQLPMGLRNQQQQQLQSAQTTSKTPINQMSRKGNNNNQQTTSSKIAGRKNSSHHQQQQQDLSYSTAAVNQKSKNSCKQAAQAVSSLNQTMIGQQSKKSTAVASGNSPSKIMNMSMANMSVLDEKRMLDQKESFVRTVFTARQQCEEFKSQIRQKEDGVIGRNYGDNKKAALKQVSEQNSHAISNKLQKQSQNEEQQQVSALADIDTTHHHHLKRKEQQSVDPHHFVTQHFGPRKGSSAKKNNDPLSFSDNNQDMVAEQQDAANQSPKKAQSDEGVNPPAASHNNEPSEKPGVSDSVFKSLVNMASSVGENSNNGDQSQHSQRLVEENQLLKEQLELVKLSLTAHQEKANTTELTMMDAILQMKDQISQVMALKSQKKQAKEDKSRVDDMSNVFGSEQHEDYHVMSHISKKSFLEDANQSQIMPQQLAGKNKQARSKIPIEQQYQTQNTGLTEQQLMRKTNSVDLRHRNETLDLTQSQADSMYKNIKIKSPNKRANQGSVGQQHHQSAQAENHNYVQKQSSHNSAQAATGLKRQQTHNTMATQKQHNNGSKVNSFIQHQQMVQNVPLTSQSFYPSSQNQQPIMGVPQTGMQERLSVGVLRQSARQNVRKQFIASKSDAQFASSHSQRYQ